MMEGPIFRDIRRYYCEYCGICRSKKALIASHVLSHHKEEIKDKQVNDNDEKMEKSSNTCEECGASFRKPAYLKQHMLGHSIEDGGPPVKLHQGGLDHAHLVLERPYSCPVDDCPLSYRRKDHLTRHLLCHQGKLFVCPIENCNHRFAFQANMKRHVKELHDEDTPNEETKLHVCPEPGCGKTFKFASKLKKHEDSHVKLDSVEAVCCEPGCFKHFTNTECLKAHIRSCHQYVTCEICKSPQLKKNIKRHLRIHEGGDITDRIKCTFKGCLHTFSNKSNLNKHIKAVHLEQRPFTCGVSGCGKKFPYKHVRDNHETCGLHVYVQGDFLELDERFRSRPRGGRKRKCVAAESLLRKRVVPPGQASALDNGSEYLSWLLSED